jgi:acyl transferase domain-containing protein
MHKMPPGGGMVAIFAAESEIRVLIDKIAPEIAVAAMNGPLNTVVSGNRDTLKVLMHELDQQHVSYRELHVSNAFHSPYTDPILDALQNVASQIKYSPPKLPLISNVTGEVMAAAPDKLYWRRHLREAVRFGDGMLALAELGCRTFVEIGPHPVLLPIAQACLRARGKSVPIR